ncbi:Ldh family oxidoreductase [Roseomonas nepalensis]|uniref:Ldh family oxidoreductase n=1 Tax=Muricoccus nepalensis TaxID=1854500 RepID=A0A502FR26_9PROT|nr:Ldh family oxidoreductase [Roseomonas nepalensis]TPG51905.1 Ldh family oxidoreductase [Roseomonas nepalensis]
MRQVPAERVRRQILGVLRAWGMPDDLAATTAEAMVETDLMGIDSHGLSMLMMYESFREAGQLDLAARPRAVLDLPATALVDGGANLGHPVADFCMRLAVEKARASGIAAVGARNSHHFGAAGHYARIASSAGMIGMITSSARTVLMVPTRGTLPLLGANPIAFAAPALRNRPFVLDISTTTVAANKVKVYDLNGVPIPEGWVVDEAGRPVTDSAEAMRVIFQEPGGGVTPLGGAEATGGHKGYGLGVMVQVLSATLTGAAFGPARNPTRKPGDPDDVGHFFLAIDPRAFRPEGGFENDMDAMIDTLRATPPADPARPVLVGGDPEAAERERRLEGGIPVPPALEAHVRAICGRSGARYELSDD